MVNNHISKKKKRRHLSSKKKKRNNKRGKFSNKRKGKRDKRKQKIEKKKSNKINLLLSLSIVLFLFIAFSSFFFHVVKVKENDLSPYIECGDIILIEKRGMVHRKSLIYTNQATNKIRRVIALPNDIVEIQRGKVSVNGFVYHQSKIKSENNQHEEMQTYYVVPEGTYFILKNGKNEFEGELKRNLIRKDEVIGTVKYRLFPFK